MECWWGRKETALLRGQVSDGGSLECAEEGSMRREDTKPVLSLSSIKCSDLWGFAGWVFTLAPHTCVCRPPGWGAGGEGEKKLGWGWAFKIPSGQWTLSSEQTCGQLQSVIRAGGCPGRREEESRPGWVQGPVS